MTMNVPLGVQRPGVIKQHKVQTHCGISESVMMCLFGEGWVGVGGRGTWERDVIRTTSRIRALCNTSASSCDAMRSTSA